MKKILVTQRLDQVPGRMEYRDAVDARWAQFLWEIGLLAIPACSGIADVSSYIQEIRPDGILITGGNDIGSVPDRDRLELSCLEYSESTGTPVFGVCRGLQIMNHHQDGELVEVSGHVAVRHEVSGSLLPMAKTVNSYHNLAVTIQTLGREMVVLAMTHDGVVEAMKHNIMPWLAVMWHPEREQPFDAADMQLIKRFFAGEIL